jgi:hypothetical protein
MDVRRGARRRTRDAAAAPPQRGGGADQRDDQQVPHPRPPEAPGGRGRAAAARPRGGRAHPDRRPHPLGAAPGARQGGLPRLSRTPGGWAEGRYAD